MYRERSVLAPKILPRLPFHNALTGDGVRLSSPLQNDTLAEYQYLQTAEILERTACIAILKNLQLSWGYLLSGVAGNAGQCSSPNLPTFSFATIDF